MLKFPSLIPTRTLVRLRLGLPVLAFALCAGAATPALADTVTSSNWAGYAVHRAGIGFKKVSASWVQPHASCVAGTPTFSAIWVGLGGYNQSSNALEQIGSELDCKASGKVSSTVWYELVPAASHTIKMRVHPGDTLSASVTMTASRAVLVITDHTSHHTFRKKLHASSIDVSSAEWIVEAPSDCIGANTCQTLPLADFGSATFTSAAAESIGLHAGPIVDPGWDLSKIVLTNSGRRFVDVGGTSAEGVATPSSISPKGTSFSVAYSTADPTQPAPTFTRRAAAAVAGRLVHPTR
jgi:hypothetical protein